jgi:serine/threonine-protein kinase
VALIPGARLGPYEVVSALGAGGMGEVWRVRDTTLHRDVALKILPAVFAQDPERLARFKREAQVLASLNHPNIAIVHGFEQADGIQALVMELVEGPTLADRISQGPIAGDEALPVARQIADALEAAHEHGIVHRDLKPANISLRLDGTVKVLDFGLAKATQTDPSTGASVSMSPTLTSPAMSQAGIIIGTAAYMSPEQARGKPVDKRTDIWAFGCVLFEMLTGKRVFEGEDVSLTLAEVIKSEPNWSALPADVPPRLKSILKRCLQKDPRQRVRDIGDVRLALDGNLDEAAQFREVPTAPQPLWRRLAPWAAGVLLGASVAGAAWMLRPQTPAPTIARFSITLPNEQLFTNAGRRLLAISPDGTRFVWVANQQLFMRSMGDPIARPIPGTRGQQVADPAFSPDGLSIAFFIDGSIRRIGVNGGTAVPLAPATISFGISWGRAGILVGQNPDGILRLSPEGGKPEVIVKSREGEIVDGPQALADGKVILFSVGKFNIADRWDSAQVVAQRLDSGERRLLVDGGSDARYLPTGHLVYAVGGSVFATRFDPERLTVVGGAIPILEGVRRAPQPTGVAQFSVSNTGTLVYIPGPAVARSSGQLDLAQVDRNGKVARLNLPPGFYEYPRVSPDGTQVAFGTGDDKDAAVSIYDMSGMKSIRRLTFTGTNRFPVWSSDGKRVAYQSDREGDLGVFWQSADGNGPAERLTRAEERVSHAPEAWSADGGTLLYSATKGSTISLWSLSMRDRKVESFGDWESKEAIDAVFSPDGHWVAYDSTEGGESHVYVEPFPRTGNTRYQVTTDASRNAFWSADGRELVYAPGPTELRVVGVSTLPTVSFLNPVPVSRGGLIGAGGPETRRNYDPVLRSGRILGVTPRTAEAEAGTPGPATIQIVLNWFEELNERVPEK